MRAFSFQTMIFAKRYYSYNLIFSSGIIPPKYIDIQFNKNIFLSDVKFYYYFKILNINIKILFNSNNGRRKRNHAAFLKQLIDTSFSK